MKIKNLGISFYCINRTSCQIMCQLKLGYLLLAISGVILNGMALKDPGNVFNCY